MRAAIIGLRWRDDPERMRAFVDASTAITHNDPRATAAARAVAIAAAHASLGRPQAELWTAWRDLDEPGWRAALERMREAHEAVAEVDVLAAKLGCGEYVSGYALHSVPLALYAWLRHRRDAAGCLGAILRCGCDTDTAGAIASALLGIDGSEAAFPEDWIARIADRPLSVEVLRRAGLAIAGSQSTPVTWRWWLQPLRNLGFIIVILAHGVRRVAP
jgi:ADP-ribosylglycohydrolase